MENSECKNPVVVREQHGMILTCVKKSLQELENGGDKDNLNPENFVVDLEENVEQQEVQVEKLCNALITQENKKEKAFSVEEKENSKDDTSVPTIVRKKPELKINNTVGIQPLNKNSLPENVELVTKKSQLENNYANLINNEAQNVDNTIDESDGNFSNEKVHQKMDNPNAVVPPNENLKIEMENTKNEDNVVAVFPTNESVQPEVNGTQDEMDNTHGIVILPNEILKTEMENTKNISNPLNREIYSDEDNIVAVFPINDIVQLELNNTQAEMDNTDVVILANRNHSSNQPQPDTLDHNDPVEVVDKIVEPEMNNTAGDVSVKLQPKLHDVTEVLDNNKELHHKLEEVDICETSMKINFVSPTSEESQTDVWIKAGDPLSSEGSFTGRWNKAGGPNANEETLTECRNKAGVLSSEEEPLLVQQDGWSKECICCKDNVAACVNTESVLINDLLEDLQDEGKCTDNQCHTTEDNKGRKKSKKQKEKKKKVTNTKKIKVLKPKLRQDEKKKDTEESKVKKNRKEKKEKSFLNRIVTFFCCCVCFNDEEPFLKKDILLINSSKGEPTMKELGRNDQCSKISLTETKLSTGGTVNGCMLDENGAQAQNEYSQIFKETAG